jgi:uncharacterized membrane protein
MALDPSLPVRDGFRLRGTSVSRLETFVDAAFAFGVSMLVISAGTIPSNMQELTTALHRVPTFAVCFLQLTMFWWAHNLWSRRFGIETGNTACMSLFFVFVMLVWVYPLRLVLGGAMNFFTGGWVPFEIQLETSSDLQTCFQVYGVGSAALNAILWSLNRTALKTKDELELDAVEVLETRRSMGVHAIHVAVATLSILMTFFVMNSNSLWMALPGFVYVLTGVGMSWHHSRFHKMRAKLATA